MTINNQLNKKLVTHDGSFHADDIFACAVLSLMLEKRGEQFEIIRTRDEEIIKNGDYIFDVGGIYDEGTNRFDHHQKNFLEKRKEGILYSSFGLVWKKFGKDFVGSGEAADSIDSRLVAPIDASDNGIDLVENKYEVSPYFIQYFFRSMRPSWQEEELNVDEMFLKSVEIAKTILEREIVQAKSFVSAKEKMTIDYKNAENKKIIILEKDYFYEDVLNKFAEPLFVIYPRKNDETWGIRAIRENSKSFKNRKDFPADWAGLREEELQKITGVPDAIFCHRALFLAVAKSKEGAVKLAQIAVESK